MNTEMKQLSWLNKYVFISPIIANCVFLVYWWFIGSYIPSLGQNIPAYDVFFPFRATHSMINDLAVSRFSNPALFIAVLLILLVIAISLFVVIKRKTRWGKVLVLSYSLTVTVGLCFLLLAPKGLSHLSYQAKSINNGIYWSLESLHASQEFMSRSFIGKLRYIFVDLCGTNSKYTIPGTTHPPGLFVVSIIVGTIAKSVNIFGDMGFSWGLIVGLINCLLVPVILSIAQKIFGKRVALWGLSALLFVPSICMHFFSMLDCFGSLFLLTGLNLLLDGLTKINNDGRKELISFFGAGIMFLAAAQITYGHVLPISAILVAFLVVALYKHARLGRIGLAFASIAVPALGYFIFEFLISSGKSFYIARALMISSQVNGFLQQVRPYPYSQIANMVLIGIFGGIFFFPTLAILPELMWRASVGPRNNNHCSGRMLFSLAVLTCFILSCFTKAAHLEVERTWHWMIALVWPSYGLIPIALERILRRLGLHKYQIMNFVLIVLPQVFISMMLAILVADYY